MSGGTAVYAILGELLEYPDGMYRQRASRCLDLADERDRGLMEELAPFREAVWTMSLEELQELYTRTFDVNPACTLEVGWHVHGEDYARGEFLVKMRGKLREHNIPESGELPDHISLVLALLWRLGAGEADELAARYVLPALWKMTKGLEGSGNPYQGVLKAVRAGVQSHHDVEMIAPGRRRGDPPGWSAPLPVLRHGMGSPCGTGGGGRHGA